MTERLRIAVRGAVQGVGFRPFVYRLAAAHALAGWVNNTAQGVFIEVEGPRESLERFRRGLEREKPRPAIIQSLEASWLDPVGYAGFEIRSSDGAGPRSTLVLPDIAACDACLREVFDPADRRHRYPFTNCTNCGPRFSIIEALPYDRPNTSMKRFEMCARCRAEYEEPLDRRFHAQPNACHDCGPRVELWDERGRAIGGDAISGAAEAIRRGEIVAVKGIGGFHLMVDALDDDAVARLRRRKHREEKPLAVMARLDWVRGACDLSEDEERLLRSPERPIVLLRRRGEVAPSVAPGNPTLGVMLPYTPLHELLVDGPVVATSGNLSDEPICIDEGEALERLGGIADRFLVHDRPIVRHVDDSVARVICGGEQILRRARGYAPLPVAGGSEGVLAVGAHQKSAVAGPTFTGQHIGDLDTAPALAAFRRSIDDLKRLYAFEPDGVACDAHPDYASTRFAEETGLPLVRVQHHHAHVLSCMADNALEPPVLGVAWDGTGYGTDGTIWGGEFLRVGDDGFERFDHLRTFPLPAGAVREPRLAALGVLYELLGDAVEMPPVLRTMLQRGVHCPRTSSAGRLFDAVASLIGLRDVCRFEGQAALELEFAIAETDDAYRIDGTDWGPMILALRDDPVPIAAAKFHNTLVEMIVEVARRAGEPRVVLTGGCFQNRYLTERAVRRLREEGFRAYRHQRVPPNDGGIALGQSVAARRRAHVSGRAG